MWNSLWNLMENITHFSRFFQFLFSFPYNFFFMKETYNRFSQGENRGSNGCFNEEPISKYCKIPYEILWREWAIFDFFVKFCFLSRITFVWRRKLTAGFHKVKLELLLVVLMQNQCHLYWNSLRSLMETMSHFFITVFYGRLHCKLYSLLLWTFIVFIF